MECSVPRGLTVLIHVEIHVIEIVIWRVKKILGVQLQARQLHLALVEVASVFRGRMQIKAEDSRLILGIVKEGLVIDYVSVTLKKERELNYTRFDRDWPKRRDHSVNVNTRSIEWSFFIIFIF